MCPSSCRTISFLSQEHVYVYCCIFSRGNSRSLQDESVFHLQTDVIEYESLPNLYVCSLNVRYLIGVLQDYKWR